VVSDGKVCCLFEQGVGSDLTVVTDLGGYQQALFAERHPHLSTDNTLCVLPRTVLFLCENITKLQHQHPNQPLLLLLPREQNQWNQDSLEPAMLQRM
jgi:hypothetical protein